MPSILLLARHYYPSPGAATNRLGVLVQALVTTGWSVNVVTRTVAGDTSDAVTSSLPERGPHSEAIYRVKGDTSTGVGARRLLELILFPLRIVRFARTNLDQPDVILADPPPTVGLAMLWLQRRRGGKTLYYFADSWQELMSASSSSAARALAAPVGWLERAVLRHADNVVAVTPGRLAIVDAAGGRGTLVSNGVDGSVFRHEPASIEPFISPTSLPYLLYAGNFGEAHGAEIFAKAADALWREETPTFAIIYMGYGSGQEILGELARRWPENILILPPQDPTIAASAYRQAICGLASVRQDENLKNAVSVKALASVMTGTPLIYAGGGDFTDLVREDSYGQAVPHEIPAVKRALKAIVNDPWTWDQRAQLAQSVAEKYDNRELAKAVVDICADGLK